MCCWRRATSEGCALGPRPNGRACSVSDPDAMSYHRSRGVRTTCQYGASDEPSNSSRTVKLPLVGTGPSGCLGRFGRRVMYGIVALPARIIGQPSVHVTGNRNVSRPVLYTL